MQFLLLLTGLLGSTVLAQQLSSSVNQQCNTRYSQKRTSTIRTTKYAATTTRVATQLITVTPRSTSTPNAVISTVTTTSVSTSVATAARSTDTYTTSKTITSTQTDTLTLSFTQTITTSSTTTIQSTETVPQPLAFTALADSPGYAAKKRNAVLDKRDAVEQRQGLAKAFLPMIPEASSRLSAKPGVQARQAGTGSQFPVAVSCTASTTFFRTTTLTSTARTTITSTLLAKTIFTTQTIPSVTTRTVTPASETFVTTITAFTSTTQTATISTTETNTNTVTVEKASATFLAQCSPQNLVSSAVAQKIGTISFNPAFTLQSLYVTEVAERGAGYACCATCANNPLCAGFAQGPTVGTQKGACYYLTTDGRCDVGQSWGDRAHYYNTNGQGYIVGNAQCGFLGFQAGRPVSN